MIFEIIYGRLEESISKIVDDVQEIEGSFQFY